MPLEVITLGKPVPKPPPPSYFVALSLGSEQFDAAALVAVVRRDDNFSGAYEGRRFQIPNAKLFEPGTGLAKLGDEVADLLERFRQSGVRGTLTRIRVLLDFGGAGPLAGDRLYYRICDERKLDWARNLILPTTITGGASLITADVGKGSVRYIPASYLASAARDCLEEKRLTVAPEVPAADRLPGELLRTRSVRSASDDLIPLKRESQMENLIYAAQLCLWAGNDPDVSRDNYLHSIEYDWSEWARRRRG